MKWTLIFIVLFSLIACNNQTVDNQLISNSKDTIQYSEKELISWLDSVGKLNPNIWVKKLTFLVDSTLKNQIKLNRELDLTNYQKLKSIIKSGEIDLDFAKQIFPNLEIDSSLIKNNKLPIGFYSFDRNEKDFNEYAVSIGNENGFSWTNDVYFFKLNKLIAKHKIFHRYGLELKHFKNEINKTVIYYKVNYGSGTGVWWHQFNFYLYDKDALLPALTEIENINCQYTSGIRAYRIKSTILNTKPLELKFVFDNHFVDTLGNAVDFIKDSVEVKYVFDTNKKIYEPKFSYGKLNSLKLLTYFLADNELLFVNVNYKLFKKELNAKEQVKRQIILNYLYDLKNRFSKEQN